MRAEAGMFSGKREYLRVTRGRFTFDICAAPYGTGFFFSWWLAKSPVAGGFLVALAIIMLWIAVFFWALWSAFSATARGFMYGGDSGGSPVIWFGFAFVITPLALYGLGWLTERGTFDEDYVLSLPILGWLYGFAFNPHSYWRYDTALMFQESIRRAVVEVVNAVRKEQGLRELSDEEVKPSNHLFSPR